MIHKFSHFREFCDTRKKTTQIYTMNYHDFLGLFFGGGKPYVMVSIKKNGGFVQIKINFGFLYFNNQPASAPQTYRTTDT